MKAAVLVAAGMSLVAATAHGEEWRDGCPAGNMKKYPGTSPRSLGAAPQQDSELVPSRVVIGVESAYYVATTGEDEIGQPLEHPRARVLTEYVALHQNIWRFGFTALISGSHRRSGDYEGPSPSRLGNLVLAAAYRRHYLYAFFGEADEHDETAHAGTIAGLRVAFAGGASVSIPMRNDVQDGYHLAAFAPFNLHWSTPKSFISFDETIAATGEIRIESVGCYAPFIHLKATAIPNHQALSNESTRWTLSLSQSIALGMYVSDHNALYVQYALALLGAGTQSGADAVHRLRAGVEHSRQHSAFGVTIDVMRGSERLNGFVLGAYFAPNWEY
ncbi:MAG: hypothetical protein H0T46_01470 [Deltaproteobacteria bacterium]|nr:hypothetical protein [Deltaproteobacteria bacterium]